MMAAAADGEVLPPYVCYKAKHIYPTWIEGGIPGSAYNRTESGWFDMVTFTDWFRVICLPYLKKQEKGKKAIIGDHLQSHISIEVVEECIVKEKICLK